MTKDWEDTPDYNESFEQQLTEIRAGRAKLADLDERRRSRLVDYDRRKREHRRAQVEEYERDQAALWDERRPKVLVRRRPLLEPAAFPAGTRIRDLFEGEAAQRVERERLARECDELRGRRDAAAAVVANFDPERADSPDEYTRAQASAGFYSLRLRAVEPKAIRARELHEFAADALRRSYAEYLSLVEELNAIPPASRPLGVRELAERAREVGRTAELLFLVDAHTAPQGARVSAA